MSDFRTPADPEDYETRMERRPMPPDDFVVKRQFENSVWTLTFCIKEREETENRQRLTGYRVYYVPVSAADTLTMKPGGEAANMAFKKAGVVVADISTVGKGEMLRIRNDSLIGVKGYYVCVGVNRAGAESYPTPVVKSPWN